MAMNGPATKAKNPISPAEMEKFKTILRMTNDLAAQKEAIRKLSPEEKVRFDGLLSVIQKQQQLNALALQRAEYEKRLQQLHDEEIQLQQAERKLITTAAQQYKTELSSLKILPNTGKETSKVQSPNNQTVVRTKIK